MFKLLVEHSANLNIKNRQGYTPLALAAELCREEVGSFLFVCLFVIFFLCYQIIKFFSSDLSRFRFSFSYSKPNEKSIGCMLTYHVRPIRLPTSTRSQKRAESMTKVCFIYYSIK